MQPLPFPDLGDDTFATHVEFQLALRVTVLVAVTASATSWSWRSSSAPDARMQRCSKT